MARTLSKAFAFLLSIHHQTSGAAPTLAEPMMSPSFRMMWVGMTTLWLSANIRSDKRGKDLSVTCEMLIILLLSLVLDLVLALELVAQQQPYRFHQSTRCHTYVGLDVHQQPSS